jgi:hypothetical protein
MPRRGRRKLAGKEEDDAQRQRERELEALEEQLHAEWRQLELEKHSRKRGQRLPASESAVQDNDRHD